MASPTGEGFHPLDNFEFKNPTHSPLLAPLDPHPDSIFKEGGDEAEPFD